MEYKTLKDLLNYNRDNQIPLQVNQYFMVLKILYLVKVLIII